MLYDERFHDDPALMVLLEAGEPEIDKVICPNDLSKTRVEMRKKLKVDIRQMQRLDPTKTKKYTVDSQMDAWYESYVKIKAAHPSVKPTGDTSKITQTHHEQHAAK